ncbi:MAG TPA: cysteine hydrolase family protein [Dissulfurispiraceae bacterium]|nr:cysteine hydrolase family protein [Dissulfurispiraceae bacterium]
MTDCLVLIDLQNDYFPDGNMELIGIKQAAANAQLLLHKFRNDDAPIIHIQHISIRPRAAFFLPGTRGADIHEMVASREGETVIVKHYPNSFRETSLLAVLRSHEIDSLVICGAMSHMCIDATTRAAFDFGFNCVVAEDACATRDLLFNGQKIRASDVHGAFMAALSVPYAKVVSTRFIIKGGA